MPPLLPLSRLLLAWLGPSLSCFFLGVLFFYVINKSIHVENRISLRFSKPAVIADGGGPDGVILISERNVVTFNSEICSQGRSSPLTALEAHIRDFSGRPGQGHLEIRVEPQAKFERIVDVLNAFVKCECYRFRLLIMPTACRALTAP